MPEATRQVQQSPERLFRLRFGINRKWVLRGGYVVVILLVVVAAIEAWRIQASVSELHMGAYHLYVHQDAAMSELRRAVWLAGNAVRDYFIDARPETAAALRRQLSELKADSDRAVSELERVRGFQKAKPELAEAIRDFWVTVAPLPDTMIHASDSERYAFVQQEVAPRRSVLYTALRELTETDQAALQRSEEEFARTRRDAAERRFLMLAVCVVLAIAVARFSLVYADNLEREAERQFAAVTRAKRELEELSARLVDIEEEGRKRLARELHDEIGQAVAILQIEITNANALPDNRLPAIREHLARARLLAEKTVQTVRDISLLLRPALLDDLGLGPALQWLLEDFMRRSSIHCELTETGVDEHLPDPVKTCVYRVVQEAIHNCEKHSAATSVRVSIRQAGGALEAEVEDDGRGFQVADSQIHYPAGGLGIVGMRERAARLGGALVLESGPGKGTRLRLTVPVPDAAAVQPSDTAIGA